MNFKVCDQVRRTHPISSQPDFPGTIVSIDHSGITVRWDRGNDSWLGLHTSDQLSLVISAFNTQHNNAAALSWLKEFQSRPAPKPQARGMANAINATLWQPSVLLGAARWMPKP